MMSAGIFTRSFMRDFVTSDTLFFVHDASGKDKKMSADMLNSLQNFCCSCFVFNMNLSPLFSQGIPDHSGS